MYRVAKSLLYNDADCADAIQDAIVTAFAKLHTLKNDKYAKTWLVRILINECYKTMRREKKLVSLDSIACPEYWQTVEIFFGEDVSKEEAVKIAENLKIETTGEMINYAEEKAMLKATGEMPETEVKTTVSDSEMQNLHNIGDIFPLEVSATSPEGEFIYTSQVTAKVSDVKVTDDFSLLDEARIETDLMAAVGADGKLLPNEITYYKQGDGVETLDEEVRKESVNQKLVYTTVEYTNTGDQDLKDVLYFGDVVGLIKEESGYSIYDRARNDGDDNTDFFNCSSIEAWDGGMDYFDVVGNDEYHKNHIPSIAAGETVTVHIANVVNEDELDKLYLLLDGAGGSMEFSESGLATGYVDIRQ